MSDIDSQNGDGPIRDEGSFSGGSRRAFVKRAALVGLPVVLATIPSRTVWARPKAGKQGAGLAGPLADTTVPSATHSSALGNVNLLFPHA
jgi:hypothetical protein